MTDNVSPDEINEAIKKEVRSCLILVRPVPEKMNFKFNRHPYQNYTDRFAPSSWFS